MNKNKTIPLVAGLTWLLASTALAQPVSGFYDIQTFGARADGRTKATDAIRKAIDAASTKGGGTIFFPAGTYLTGPIHLKSNITLYLDSGALVKFSQDFDDYLPMVPGRWEGIEVTNFSPFIYASHAENIAIRGRGILDGQGKAWWAEWFKAKGQGSGAPRSKWQEEFKRLNPKPLVAEGYKTLEFGFLRPPFIQPYACTNVLIEGIKIINSPFWTVSPLYCDNVTVQAVTIDNPESPNTDGINPDSCRNVHIMNCQISVGDDCITIKSGRDADGRRVGRPAENYTISNCTMANGHGGVVIGSEASGGVKKITISNCVFDGTERGIRIKSARGRGGVIEDVRVSNVVMKNIGKEAFVLTSFYEKSNPEPVSERTPVFRNMHFSGVIAEAGIAGQLLGLEELPLDDITFSDIRIDAKTGFSVTDAANITFDHVTVNTEKGPAIAADRTSGLDISSVKTLKPHADQPVVDLKAVKRVFIHGSVAAPGTGTFVHVAEASASEVVMEGNSLAEAKTAISKTGSKK